MLLRLVLALVLVGMFGAGCSGGSGPAAAPSSAPGSSTSGSPSGSATPSTSRAVDLPTGCDSLLPFTELDRALGRPLFGQTLYTKGVAQPSIGRTGRVTCRYGVARNGKGAAPVEVGVSTYTDVESATRRVQSTISDLRSMGARQADATVSGLPATVLGTGTSFTVVLGQGARTIAVTLQRSLHGSSDRTALAVAERVLANLDQ
ncbi:MAG: hypothetical protein ACJ73E_18300 [Mycobacteriales bacterium]